MGDGILGVSEDGSDLRLARASPLRGLVSSTTSGDVWPPLWGATGYPTTRERTPELPFLRGRLQTLAQGRGTSSAGLLSKCLFLTFGWRGRGVLLLLDMALSPKGVHVACLDKGWGDSPIQVLKGED